MLPVKTSSKALLVITIFLAIAQPHVKNKVAYTTATDSKIIPVTGSMASSVQTAPAFKINTQEELAATIAAQEYFISNRDSANSFQSPNRKQHLRSIFQPGKWTVTPREKSDQGNELIFTLNGVYSDNQLRFNASKQTHARVHENMVEFDHSGLFTVQYINKPDGIEQTFVVYKNPGLPNKKIAVKMRVNNGWRLQEERANEITISGESRAGKINYKKLKAWDAGNHELDASMHVETDHVISIEVDTRNAVYPVTIDPTVTAGTNWGVESNQASSGFGCSIFSAGDVNGDGYSDVIIGANKYDNTFTDEGAAFMYLGGPAGISTTASWTYYGGQAGAEFGTSVSTAADVNGDGYADVLIGAPKYDDGQTDEGKVFAFYGGGGGICAGGSLSTVPNWTAKGNQAGALFGYSVAAAGDVDNDGYSDIVIGAPSYDNGETDEGVVFYYKGQGPKPCLGAGGGLQNIYTNLLEVNQAGANFGVSVAGAGDVNGDNFYDIVAGANLYDNGETNEGNIFVWHGKSGALNTAWNFRMEENQAGSNYGISVSTAGDVNGDGYSDIIVGANLWSSSNNTDDCAGAPGGPRPLVENGKAFMYPGSSAGSFNPLPAAKWDRQAIVDYSHFGSSVACAGDINGDGYSDVIVGSADYDEITAVCALTFSNSGRAYIYEGGDAAKGLGSASARGLFSGGANNVGVGYSVAPAGDINGDGFSDILTSSISFTNGEPNEGKVWSVYGTPFGLDNVNLDVDWTGEQNQASSYYGVSVASAGDVNGDGFGDVIIGAHLYDNTQTNEGAAFVHLGTAAGINGVAAWSVYGGQNTATLGYSVACAGDVNGDGYSDVVVSAYQYDNGGFTDNGKVDIYFGSAAGLSATPNWTKSGNANNQYFGYSVACAGDVNLDGYSDVMIGAQQYSNGETNEGAAFVFHGSATGPSSTADWIMESNKANANFGFSVACAGDINGDGFNDIIVGAPNYNNTLAGEGRVSVYHGSATGLATIANWTKDGGVASMQFGYSVASAGDVNADAFSDVIIGSPFYSNGQANEGRVQEFNGSSGGLSAAAAWSLESNAANFNMGYSATSAGDVNSDGYSDVVVGIPGDAKGRSNCYHGSIAGLSSTLSWTTSGGASTTAGARLGNSLAPAGDVNGDGFSDVIVGSPLYSRGELNEGIVRIYYGGEKQNAPNNVWLLNSDLAKTIDHTNKSDNLFGIAYNGRCFLGRSQGRIAWETQKQGVPFNSYGGIPISKIATQTARQAAFTSIALNGYLYKQAIAKVLPSKTTKSRLRIQYPAVNAITGQIMGPWRYLSAYMQGGLGFWSLPLPVKLLSFDAQLIQKEVVLNWKVADEHKAVQYEIERSTDGIGFSRIATVSASLAQQSYHLTDGQVPDAGKLYYRLVIREADANTRYSDAIVITLPNRGRECIQYADKTVFISCDRPYEYILTDINGRPILKGRGAAGAASISLSDKAGLLPGTYIFSVLTQGATHVSKKIIL
jgi:hypothetical protein